MEIIRCGILCLDCVLGPTDDFHGTPLHLAKGPIRPSNRHVQTTAHRLQCRRRHGRTPSALQRQRDHGAMRSRPRVHGRRRQPRGRHRDGARRQEPGLTSCAANEHSLERETEYAPRSLQVAREHRGVKLKPPKRMLIRRAFAWVVKAGTNTPSSKVST